MPASKAQQKAVHKYTKENYDRFLVTMKPKGRLETVKAHAAARGESTNAFIGRAIQETMERDTALPPETVKAAQEAAEAAGEGLPQFGSGRGDASAAGRNGPQDEGRQSQ